MKKVYYFFALFYLPCLLLYTLLFKSKGGFLEASYFQEFAFYLLLTFPFYLVYLEVGIIGEKMKEMEEKWLDLLCVFAAIGILITTVNFLVLLFLRYVFAAVLLALWIVDMTVYKRKSMILNCVKGLRRN